MGGLWQEYAAIGGKFGWIIDPDGNRIGLWEPLPKKQKQQPARKTLFA